jgi:hypothetical protein
MRKITSKLLFSTAGFAFQGGDEEETSNKLTYNGIEFFNQNGFWFSRIGGIDFVFKYNPKEVKRQDNQFQNLFENTSQLKYFNNYYDKPLYISSDTREAEREIYSNLNQIILRMQYACVNEEECEGDFPVKSCENNFIIIKESNETGITQVENCVFINGAKENLTRLTDEFFYKILQVN